MAGRSCIQIAAYWLYPDQAAIPAAIVVVEMNMKLLARWSIWKTDPVTARYGCVSTNTVLPTHWGR